MKVVLLAGGFGTRLSEYTQSIPKPMVAIGGKPILWHIMNHYAKFGFNEFVIALGYKSEIIKEYFHNYRISNSDFQINLGSGEINPINYGSVDWKVTLVSTGLDTMTGGRLLRLKKVLGEETFMLTYGDGLADINIENLLSVHKKQGKMVTMSAVHPSARFGELDISENEVTSFKEKPQLAQGWINGGYFVMEPKFIDYIEGDHIMLEREPMEEIVSKGQLAAYCHEGFWQCMDTKRDHELLEFMWKNNKAPWA